MGLVIVSTSNFVPVYIVIQLDFAKQSFLVLLRGLKKRLIIESTMCLVPQCSQITVLIAKAARPDRTKQKIRPIDSALHTNLNYTFFVAIVFLFFAFGYSRST